MLTPVDIHEKTFRRSLRGYDIDEVNLFLDEIIKSMAGVMDENEKLKTELALERKANEEFRRLEESVRNTLAVAQKTANEVMSKAKNDAEKLRESAGREGENIRREAQLIARNESNEAATKLRFIVDEYERLVQEKRKFLKRMKIAFETELKLIDDDLNAMPDSQTADSSTNEPAPTVKEELTIPLAKLLDDDDTLELGMPLQANNGRHSGAATLGATLSAESRTTTSKPSLGLPPDDKWGL